MGFAELFTNPAVYVYHIFIFYRLEKQHFMQIKSAEFRISSSRADMCPDTRLPEYAFIGRSNVGKSSLINMLTQRKGLAMISSTPGKTMLINHFLVNDEWYLVDLPGYGFARRSKRDIEKLRNLISYYVLERSQLTCLFVLIDSRLKPQQIDLDFIHFLGEHSVPFALVFTKADKPSGAELSRNVKAFLMELSKEWEELPPHFVTSSEKGRGREDFLNYIEALNESVKE